MSEEHDPTRVRAQAQLTTASGTMWVVMGLITAVLVGVMFALLAARLSSPTALVALALCVGLPLGMLAVRFLVRPGRVRLGLLAGLYLGLVAASLITVILVTAGL